MTPRSNPTLTLTPTLTRTRNRTRIRAQALKLTLTRHDPALMRQLRYTDEHTHVDNVCRG
mgnify:CR=1 FL=1